MNNNLLSFILFEPLVGALLILLISKHNENAIRWIANITALAGFLISVPLWFWFNSQGPDFQFVERATWIPSIGADYFLGVDGLSVLLILLTTMMGSIAVLSSWTAITERVKEYYIFLLLLQTGMLGAFMSLDFLLFFLFWEVMLVPMYFLIGIWGGANRLYSAIKFFLYTLVGSVVMLLGILALYFYNHSVTGVYTFDVTQFQKLTIPFNLQWWVLPRVLPGLRDQGADVPVPHLAAGCAHRRADGRLGDSGRRPPEDGDVRVPAVQPADSARRLALLRADDRHPLDHRHRLRRAGGAGAEGLEAARRLFVGQPHGDGDARHVRAQRRSASPAASSSSSITASRPARSSSSSASSTSGGTRARSPSTAACRRSCRCSPRSSW